MYARTAQGRELNLGVSGKLWQSSLVMIDQETESLWSQLLGEAMQGPLEGEKLTVIPSVMADWQAWKLAYPKTTAMILPRTASAYRNELHLLPLGLLIGLSEGAESRAWDLQGLQSQGLLNDQFGPHAVLVVYDPASGTPLIYDRKVRGQLLEFELHAGKLVDGATKSQWNLVNGLALAGPLQGHRLKRLPGVVSTHPAWFTFHANSTLELFPGVAP